MARTKFQKQTLWARDCNKVMQVVASNLLRRVDSRSFLHASFPTSTLPRTSITRSAASGGSHHLSHRLQILFPLERHGCTVRQLANATLESSSNCCKGLTSTDWCRWRKRTADHETAGWESVALNFVRELRLRIMGHTEVCTVIRIGAVLVEPMCTSGDWRCKAWLPVCWQGRSGLPFGYCNPFGGFVLNHLGKASSFRVQSCGCEMFLGGVSKFVFECQLVQESFWYAQRVASRNTITRGGLN